MDKDKKNKLKKLAIYSIIFVAYAVIFTLLIGSACPSSIIFGMPCPACGMTRANLLFLTFNFEEAFIMHPLFFFSIILFVILIVVNIKEKIIENKIFNICLIVFALAFIITYIVRMVLYFPNVEPLTINENSLLFLIISLFK